MHKHQYLKNKLEQYKGQKEIIEKQIQGLQDNIFKNEKYLNNVVKAQWIIQEVARQTQEAIKYEISEPVSLAINSIFCGEQYKYPYRFVFDFIVKRNKTVCDYYLVNRDNEKENPIEDCGGGIVDIICFALRISICIISNSRRVVILDEPFKWLDKNKEEEIGKLLRMICEKLGFQIIMVTHNSNYASIADKCFAIKKDKRGVSYVT